MRMRPRVRVSTPMMKTSACHKEHFKDRQQTGFPLGRRRLIASIWRGWYTVVIFLQWLRGRLQWETAQSYGELPGWGVFINQQLGGWGRKIQNSQQVPGQPRLCRNCLEAQASLTLLTVTRVGWWGAHISNGFTRGREALYSWATPTDPLWFSVVIKDPT